MYCRLYIIVTKNKHNNNYYYYYHYYNYYMVLYEKIYWKNIKALFLWCCVQKKETMALFFQILIYLSLREIRNLQLSPLDGVTVVIPRI